MKRVKTLVLGVLMLMGTGMITSAVAAEMKAIATQKTQDVVVTLMSESGQWKPGRNAFVLQFTSPKDNQPVDAGKVSLSTSMSMPGMAPMIAGATLTPDKAPGRYTGTISFPDAGVRQAAVTWEGPAGKGSAKFSVPVR